jgi:hypothetical protein
LSIGATLLGLFAGVSIGLYGALRESRPEYIDRWARGAEGERRTAKQLARLVESGYVVRHDLLTEWGNWDHVVVGPTGVFLLDSKALSGSIGVGSGEVFVMRSEDPTDNYVHDVGRVVRGQAYDLHTRISEHAGSSLWVQGVVVFWGRFDERVFDDEEVRVSYVHGDDVADWIERQRRSLGPKQIRAAIRYLNKHSANPGPGA